ncbi:retrotransposon protein, putative, ty1-copia subclass, partial [Tanacetum coccineum]
MPYPLMEDTCIHACTYQRTTRWIKLQYVVSKETHTQYSRNSSESSGRYQAFNTSVGNPVKKILLKLNLSDHSKSHIVLGIAPVAIIDRQLPFEYTITSRSTDVVVMKGYVDQLERLGYMLPHDLIVEKSGKGKDKQVYIPKPKNPKPSAKEHPAKDDTCHHCKEVGHWKRNCPVYLDELLKKKKQVGSASSSGNGVRAQVEAIGSYDLVLPNGLVICLDNCHYAPSITRGVVSVHRLVENGFV